MFISEIRIITHFYVLLHIHPPDNTNLLSNCCQLSAQESGNPHKMGIFSGHAAERREYKCLLSVFLRTDTYSFIFAFWGSSYFYAFLRENAGFCCQFVVNVPNCCHLTQTPISNHAYCKVRICFNSSPFVCLALRMSISFCIFKKYRSDTPK